jgi:hypothetical protein
MNNKLIFTAVISSTLLFSSAYAGKASKSAGASNLCAVANILNAAKQRKEKRSEVIFKVDSDMTFKDAVVAESNLEDKLQFKGKQIKNTLKFKIVCAKKKMNLTCKKRKNESKKNTAVFASCGL